MPTPPSTVSPGQPITSAWGNDVVATFNDINNRLATRIHGGYASVTTDAYGDLTLGFGMTFASPPLIVATLTATGAGPALVVMVQAVTTVAFTVRVYVAENGGAAGNTPVNLNWIAFIGWLN